MWRFHAMPLGAAFIVIILLTPV